MKNFIYKVSIGSVSLPDGFIIEYREIDDYSYDGYLVSDGYFYANDTIYNICDEAEFNIKLSNNSNLLNSFLNSKMTKNVDPFDSYINRNKLSFFNFLANLHSDGYSTINYDGYSDFSGIRDLLDIGSKYFKEEKIKRDGYLDGYFYVDDTHYLFFGM
jgi:hypothetical protein